MGETRLDPATIRTAVLTTANDYYAALNPDAAPQPFCTADLRAMPGFDQFYLLTTQNGPIQWTFTATCQADAARRFHCHLDASLRSIQQRSASFFPFGCVSSEAGPSQPADATGRDVWGTADGTSGDAVENQDGETPGPGADIPVPPLDASETLDGVQLPDEMSQPTDVIGDAFTPSDGMTPIDASSPDAMDDTSITPDGTQPPEDQSVAPDGIVVIADSVDDTDANPNTDVVAIDSATPPEDTATNADTTLIADALDAGAIDNGNSDDTGSVGTDTNTPPPWPPTTMWPANAAGGVLALCTIDPNHDPQAQTPPYYTLSEMKKRVENAWLWNGEIGKLRAADFLFYASMSDFAAATYLDTGVTLSDYCQPMCYQYKTDSDLESYCAELTPSVPLDLSNVLTIASVSQTSSPPKSVSITYGVPDATSMNQLQLDTIAGGNSSTFNYAFWWEESGSNCVFGFSSAWCTTTP